MVPSPGPSESTLASRPSAAHHFLRRRSRDAMTRRGLCREARAHKSREIRRDYIEVMRFFALVQQHRCPWQRHATSGHQNTPYHISLRRLRRPMAAAAARKKLRFAEIISRVYLRVMTCSWVFSTSRNTVVLHGINGFARSYHTNISIFTVFRLTTLSHPHS